MDKNYKIDISNLCLLSYLNQAEIKEEFNNLNFDKQNQNQNQNLNTLTKCKNIPILLSGEYDVQAYVCEYENSITIVFRGTESYQDLLNCLNIIQVPFYLPDISYHNTPKVHRGFYLQFNSIKHELENQIKNILSKNKKNKLIFAGHSLGGALASLASLYFTSKIPEMEIFCLTLGSPRAGDNSFVEIFNERVPYSYRFVNHNDPVPFVPTSWRFGHVKGLIWINETPTNETYIGQIYRFFKNTLLDWFGYGYVQEALQNHNCSEYIKDMKLLPEDN